MSQTTQGLAQYQVAFDTSAEKSVQDLLDVVNGAFRSILSDDVMMRLNGTTETNGYYTNRVLHSERDREKTIVKRDADYMDAVESGDMDTAQQIPFFLQLAHTFQLLLSK